MPRPKNKLDLLAAIEKERGALDDFLGGLSQQEMVDPGVVGDWSVKDVLAHLTAWEGMCLGWYQAGERGETPQLPAPGFKWNQTPQLNQQIFEEHQDDPLEKVLKDFHLSSREILGLIQDLSNEQLFTPGQYHWTKKNTLGTYLVSATSSHYAWARKEIKKGLKRKRRQNKA